VEFDKPMVMTVPTLEVTAKGKQYACEFTRVIYYGLILNGCNLHIYLNLSLDEDFDEL
jgi:hypothetical protein